MEVRQVQLEEIEGVLALIDQYDRPTSQRPGPEQIKEIYARIVGSGGCMRQQVFLQINRGIR